MLIWIEAIRQALIDLNGKGTEPEILQIIEKNGYRPYDNARTPQRSLNMYLNQKLRGEVEKVGNQWILLNYRLEDKIGDSFNDFNNKLDSVDADTVKGVFELENRMKNQQPELKQKISKYIERGVIATKVKTLTNFRCLICEQQNNHQSVF